MYLCLLPPYRVFTMGAAPQDRVLVVFSGDEHSAFGPLENEDEAAISQISLGAPVAADAPVVSWLIKKGFAEAVDSEVSGLPPGWDDAHSRQLSSYSLNSGVIGALEIQRTIERSHAFVVGVGGIGCNIIFQLLRIGVSRFTLIDPDVVEISNLNRQVLFTSQDIGRTKVHVAREYIERNSRVPAQVVVHACDFLTFSMPRDKPCGKSLAVISGDNAAPSIHRHAAHTFFSANIPYGFASYCGRSAKLGPLVFNTAHGCGCCGILAIHIESALHPVIGPGIPSVPPSSLSTNTMLSSLFVDRWIRSLSGANVSGTITIAMDSLVTHYSPLQRLASCPVCSHAT